MKGGNRRDRRLPGRADGAADRAWLPNVRVSCTLRGIMHLPEDRVTDAVNRLVDEYRHRYLWFLREDFYPDTPEQKLRVLEYIQRHGDRAAYRRAAELRGWLSPDSSAPSAAS